MPKPPQPHIHTHIHTSRHQKAPNTLKTDIEMLFPFNLLFDVSEMFDLVRIFFFPSVLLPFSFAFVENFESSVRIKRGLGVFF